MMQEPHSLKSLLRKKSKKDIEKAISAMTEAEAERLLFDWQGLWARDNQLPPEWAWQVWLVLAGRGFGKTRTGVEWIREEVEAGRRGRLAIVSPTAADGRDVIAEGESGILAISPKWFMPVYESSKRRITWPNGAIATLYSAEEPERLRGPQHDGALCDELCAWKYVQETWDMLMFGLRLGRDPRAVITTTPKPIKVLKELVKRDTTAITKGTTYDNIDNLAPLFIEQIVKPYEGTRLGRQELNAEILDDNPNALWQRNQIEESRVTSHPKLLRIVVAIDPQGTDNEDSAETGIVVAALGQDREFYVLEDATTKGTPNHWGRQAVSSYNKYVADRIIGEVNNGGDMVEHTIKTVDNKVAYKAVRASRGKLTRAEPVSALYEQGRVHHIGSFPTLEDQMCEWEPGMDSPDRMDALVWAITELMGGRSPIGKVDLSGLDLTGVSKNII